MPRKQAIQPRARATVDAILTATARLLVRDGYDRTSTNRVAEAAGVSIGSLYQYYPSKEALVAALLDRHIAEMSALVHREAEAARDRPVRVVIERMVKAMLAAHAVDPKLHKVLVEQVPRVGRLDRMSQFEQKTVALARTFLEERKSELRLRDLDIGAFVLVSTLESLTHAAVLYQPELLADDRLADEIRDVALRYLLP